MEAQERIHRNVKLLTNFTYQGVVHLRIWKRLLNDNGICVPDEEIAKRYAHVFFFMSGKAHFESAFIHLSRLVDRSSKRATSIFHLLEEIEKFPAIFERVMQNEVLSQVQADRKKLSDMNKFLENLKNRRDKYYAHLSKDIIGDSQSVFRDNPLTANEMESAYELVGNVLNGYSNFLDGSSTMMGMIDEDDVGRLLKYVGVKLRMDKEERQRSMQRHAQ